MLQQIIRRSPWQALLRTGALPSAAGEARPLHVRGTAHAWIAGWIVLVLASAGCNGSPDATAARSRAGSTQVAGAGVTIWPSTAVPSTADIGPDRAIELGVKFRSDVAGSVTGIRFFKAAGNGGTHVGNLWSSSGKRLATATFTAETASGWQQVNFTSPVAITANTTYVASYHTNVGHYARDLGYFAKGGVDAAPLHALANGVSGANGVYAYGSTSTFPRNGNQSSNFWVDLVFTATTKDTTPPTVTAFTVPVTASTLTVGITTLTATDDVAVTGYLVNESAAAPSATAAGWSAAAPSSYTFATAGTKTLYAWAKDAAGNVSRSMSASVVVTLASVPEPAGWYAGDMHVHRSCGGSPEAISSMYSRMGPQNLAVMSLLADMGNGEVQDATQDLPRVNGQDDPVSTPGRTVHWDAEWHWDATYSQYPHQALGGHVVALGVNEAHQIWQEYTAPIFDWAHQAGGIAGFAHMQYLDNGIPQTLSCCTPIEYPVEVALGKSDFVSEDVFDTGGSFSGMNPEAAVQAYYRLLNCGFRPGFAAGTDYPCNSGRPLGSLLTYVQVASGPMTYRGWVDGIAKGRTVVSRNGHNEFLKLTVNGTAGPGDEIALSSAGTVSVTVDWSAIQSLTGTIELVSNGTVVASKQASVAPGSAATLTASVPFAKSGWLAARRMATNGHQVHTAAVFVTVGGAPVRASAADANFYVQWMDNLLQKTSAGGPWASYFPTSLSAAQARYQSARALYQQIASEASAQPAITTTALPGAVVGVSYTSTLAASGGKTPYTWSIPTGLPPGLSVDPTGVISGTPSTVGTYGFTVTLTDASAQTATAYLGITVAAAGSSTMWPAASAPVVADSGPDNAVELGVKFRSDVAGLVTGVRFYKGAGNTGTHVGNLWSSSGALLATAAFTGESASGWQQVTFASPLAITANTVYVASYHTNVGHYSADQNYFSRGPVDNVPLHALADGASGPNGVFAYGSGSSFPSSGWNASNYWVDVVFTPSAPSPTLQALSIAPANATMQPLATLQLTATGTYSDGSTHDVTGAVAWSSSNNAVVTIDATGLAKALGFGTVNITAASGAVSQTTTLTVSPPPPPPPEGPGGPILIVSGAVNPFSRYYAEVLRAEGFNEFLATDVSSVTSAMLAGYDVVVLGEFPLSSVQADMFAQWVAGGGNLIAMRPDAHLSGLLGLVATGGTLAEGYVLVNTAGAPGRGLVGETMQFHGAADLYTVNGSTPIATLYSGATTATSAPAVTLRAVGLGQAAAFTYDLARSIVYTRQGNRAWSGQERDGIDPIRSDDLFYGQASFDPETDWIDFNKVQIPQADEQQRLLTNLILQMNLRNKPLPRFWFLPSGFKAAVVMTGDDHANGGTAGRFDAYIAASRSNCSVADWGCVRSTSYVYPNSPITNAQAQQYTAAGFEVALHVTTNCANFTSYADLDSYYTTQLASFASRYWGIPAPVTNRTHCIAWSDYDTQPKVELSHGIRLDASYYYWPGSWLKDRPGLMTGSGLPMRFADRTGQTIDVYQAMTQMTDESGQTYPLHIDTLLDNAIGPAGYYGVFTANMHTDTVASAGSDAIVASAGARGIPIVSARQMISWLDARNASSFGSLAWDGSVLSFNVSAAAGARNLRALLPTTSAAGLSLTGITRAGAAVPFGVDTIKGVSYATFAATTGTYQATYR